MKNQYAKIIVAVEEERELHLIEIKKQTNKQKGITLVALVITIIILLILAGITISSLTQSGLFEKAQQAKQKTEDAQAEENAALAEYEKWMTNYMGGSSSGGGKILTDTADTKPAQAMPANATVIENDLRKGIVIKDSNNNEWTWVVVPKTIYGNSQYTVSNGNRNVTSETDYEGIYNIINAYASTYRKGSATQSLSWTDEWYEGCGIVATVNKTGSQVYTEMYNKMLSSVYTNGGFWISRYEAGIEGTNIDTTSNTIEPVRYEHNDITSTSPKAVSQPNRIPYNWIYCSEAQVLASTMSPDTSKTSSLLFGIQWDLVCKYLEEKGNWDTTTNTAAYYLNCNSTNWGNCKNSSVRLKENSRYCTLTNSSSGKWSLYNVSSDFVTVLENLSKTNNSESYYGLLTTGASEDANKMNIYDFAGNADEWTLEHATSITDAVCAVRGGYFSYDSATIPVSFRDCSTTSYSPDFIGFRATLY